MFPNVNMNTQNKRNAQPEPLTALGIPRWKTWLQAATLVGIGCMQLTGDLLGNQGLKGLGALTHASPAPKVFTTQNGYETYSPIFEITALDDNGLESSLQLTPAVNARVRGPYNRRNAYGAAISYGPVLASSPATLDMFTAAFRYGFCDANGVAQDIGLPAANRYRVDIQSRGMATEQQANWPNRFQVNCANGQVTYLATRDDV